MKLSTKERHNIRNNSLKMLSEMNDHMIEYGKSEVTGTAVNEFTNDFIKTFIEIPNTSLDQTIGNLRKDLREIYREVRHTQEMTPEMQYLYDELMGATKTFMPAYQDHMMRKLWQWHENKECHEDCIFCADEVIEDETSKET